MGPFQPGDMVECIRSTNTTPVQTGTIWTVAEVTPLIPCLEHEDDCHGVFVSGYMPRHRCPYCQHCFRLVYRPKADLIERLTAEPVVADAPKVRTPHPLPEHSNNTKDV